MSDNEHDLSQFYRGLDTSPSVYGRGPEFSRIDTGPLTNALKSLSDVHAKLLAAHNQRIKAATVALKGWEGPAALTFLDELNANKPTQA